MWVLVFVCWFVDAFVAFFGVLIVFAWFLCVWYTFVGVCCWLF